MKLFNTLSRKKEEFTPINPPNVGMYTCGPTVYYYPQIGNWRTFVFEDILRRSLEYNGLKVNHVMNATDVGHLTGDNLGNADIGEDRMEKAAKKEGKTAWEIAEFYISDFTESRDKLGILPPTHFVRATEHIKEQIDLIERLEKNGFTYKTALGVYFDISKLKDYGKLGGQKMIDKRAITREELKEDTQKKSPFDFALWKFSGQGENRQMEWDSPWGVGFPGWHIECSAMSMKYLGETFDIHTGGIDHIAIHHTNEIAQSEGATGKPFAKYWLHAEFLLVDGGRMGKSLGNAYTLHDVVEKGFDPLSLRYFYLGAHYKSSLNFTWEALESSKNSLNRLREQVLAAKKQTSRTILSEEKSLKITEFTKSFENAINDDLNTPQALAVLWAALKSNIPSEDKYDLAIDFDRVLGLNLASLTDVDNKLPVEVVKLLEERENLRKSGEYEKADGIRKKIENLGFSVSDREGKTVVKHL